MTWEKELNPLQTKMRECEKGFGIGREGIENWRFKLLYIRFHFI